MGREGTVTLILPKDMTKLNELYTKTVANIVSEMLSHDEIEYLIKELEKKENNG